MLARGTVPIGGILLERGLVSRNELDAALAEQLRTGGRLGDILIGAGVISALMLHRAVAEHYSLPLVDLLKEPPEAELLSVSQLEDYIRLRLIPWKRSDGKIIVATSEPGDAATEWARRHIGQECGFAITSPYDIRRALEMQFGPVLDEGARLTLYRLAPEQSAHNTFNLEQKFVLAALVALLALAVFYAPAHVTAGLLVGLHALYGVTMLFKWLLFREGLRNRPDIFRLEAEEGLPEPQERDLPIYTLLIPLYREARSVPRLAASLRALDYSASRLDIKLVLEEDDEETINAAMALKPAWNVDILRVPYSLPRTKPKACNYALRFARGEFVTIYDAEDAPAPDQLRKAVAAFRAAPENVACLQARLNYYNAGENWLTRWFALEYGILFHALLPGLQALKMPIPLGGTSNHLSLSRLRAVGEWDPYNVTEDADLGVRLSARGLRTMMLDSDTLEEAPLRLGAWMRQRTRWIKGYMQTWLVYMRHPLRLLKQVGPVGFLGLQFFVGLSWVSFLTAPLVWGMVLATWANAEIFAALNLPEWFMWLSGFNFLLLFAVNWQQAAMILPRLPEETMKNKGKFALAALTFPLYWALHSVASFRALWQLVSRPHYWDKTEHGLTRMPAISSEPAPENIAKAG